MLVCSVMLLKIKLPDTKGNGGKFNKLRILASNAKEGLDHLRYDKKMLLAVLFSSIFLLVLSVIRIYISFYSIGYPIDVRHCMLATAVAGLGTVISLTPSGLGVREAIIGYTVSSLNVSMEIGLLAALADRTAGLFVLLLLGSVGYFYLKKI